MKSDSQMDTTRTVTRRQAVGLAGAGGAAMLLAKVTGADRLLGSVGVAEDAQAQATSCVLIPAKTEGPYFVDEKLDRSDIRTDPSTGSTSPGVPVNLTMVVVRADASCAPVQGAVVDVWHADATGKYSDIASEGTTGKKYLRGLQATDANGAASFTTVFPGWYSGRAVHIHFKVRVFSGSSTTYEFNSQLFFDPAITNEVYATSAYSSRGTPNVANSADNIYGSDGAKLLVQLTPNASGGYDGTFVIGLSGLPAIGGGTGTDTDTSTANSVAAALSATSFRRTASHRRILRATSTVAETVKIKARLSRNGTTIVSKTVAGVTSGVRAVDLGVPRSSAGGGARLTMTYTDAAGLTKTVRRTVTVPRRRAA
ncbi:MAG TPA: intradiol ring-cleavage dioxygenase [Solirubrobacteraceae bacterium]|nr:intradiol ring-cleavage dioxygenase [Solirubrobacteraceae bacterium]